MASTSGNKLEGEQKVTINYDLVKQKYFDLVERNIELLKGPLCTKEGIEERIRLVQTDPSKAKNYIIEIVDGKNKLYLKRGVWQCSEVISVEDAFDVLWASHIACFHGNASITYEKLTQKYSVPIFCASWIVESCNVCNPSKVERPNPVETSIVSSRGLWRLNLITGDALIENSDRAQYLLIFKEDTTNFVVLRPVFESSEEFALEIFRLFSEFGYPEKVCVPDMIVYYRKIFQIVYLINPVVEVPVEQVTSDRGIFEKDMKEVLTELNNWADMMQDSYWEQSCHIVQYKLNTTEKLFTRLFSNEKFVGTPFNQFFNYRYRTKMTWMTSLLANVPIKSEPADNAETKPVLE